MVDGAPLLPPSIPRDDVEELPPWRVCTAAHFIRDALDCIAHVHPLPTPLARRAHLIFLWCEPLMRIGLLALVLLCFFETPTWCATVEQPCVAHRARYPLFGLPMLSQWSALSIESFLLALLCARLALELTFQGWERFIASRLQASNFSSNSSAE